ncbi:toll/interleukin-1 receptor domain-containing protein [Sulfuriferula sp. GW1]|uniref:toll/interleukin-1 receptor domain-containing protein n=1 Tax=Sulfuriferula sp. GW1 TaxID=3345111 RepID=UPI0039AEEF7B
MCNTLFVSHASEDKSDFVRPLAQELRRLGLNVWYDEFTLKPGDSLRRSIDKGLAECEAGIVVLSRHFFAKEWPQRELDALLGANIAGNVKLVPIWHGIDVDFVRSVSPLLADLVALKSVEGIEAIALKVAELFPPVSSVLNEVLASKLEQFLSARSIELEWLAAGCQYRFLQAQALYAEYEALANTYFENLTDNEIDEQQAAIEVLLREKRAQLFTKYGLSNDINITPSEPISEEKLRLWLEALDQWVSGMLGEVESMSLLRDLDFYMDDYDYLYIFFGIPNYAVSMEQRLLLDRAVRIVGDGEIDSLCPLIDALRNKNLQR